MSATSGLEIHGQVAPGFERVREAFAANFERSDAYREVGAALTVYRRDTAVVELWAGHADRAHTRPWQRDSLINVYSTTKGWVASLVAMLVDDGVLDYDAPVTRWWPQYGEAGKSATTLAQLLSHQAGLTGFMQPTPLEALYDWDTVCAQLAAQAPCWPPGTATSYHAMTWGYLVGEVIRRASGVTVGELIDLRLRKPLSAEVFVGLPLGEEARVAEMLAPREAPDLSALTQPPQALMALVNPQLDPEVANARAWRAAEIPAANGQASALGIARLYAMLAADGMAGNRRLLAPETLSRMTQVQAQRADLLIGLQNNWGMGISLNQMNMFGPDPAAFGHAGWGGSFGCASRAAGVGIGYVCNQMGAQLVGDPRGAGLCAAVFECL